MDKLLKIIEYGLYLLVFILPWQARWIIQSAEIKGKYFEYATFSLYASDILLVVLLSLALFWLLLSKKKIIIKNIPKYWWALAAFDLSVFVSCFRSSNHILSIYKYAWFLLGIALFVLLVNFSFNKKKLLFSLGASLTVESLLAIYQFLNQASPAGKYLGMAIHDPINLGVSVVEGIGNLGFIERWLRAYGSLDHPNMLGGFLVMGFLLIILWFVLKSKNIVLLNEAYARVKIFRLNIIIFPIILVLFIAIFFVFSRAAWLALALSLLSLLFLAVISRDKLLQKYLLPIILYLGILLFIFSIPFGNLIEARLKVQGRLEYISKVERIKSAQIAKDVLRDHWLFGTGIGTYTLSLRDKYLPNKEAYVYQPTHNTFLLIWAETGIIGILSFLAFFIMLFFNSLNKKDIFFKIPLFIALSILLFFDHWWWSLHFGVLYFYLILALVVLFSQVDKNKNNMV